MACNTPHWVSAGSALTSPPSGLLTEEQHVYFVGPSPPGTDISNCRP